MLNRNSVVSLGFSFSSFSISSQQVRWEDKDPAISLSILAPPSAFLMHFSNMAEKPAEKLDGFLQSGFLQSYCQGEVGGGTLKSWRNFPPLSWTTCIWIHAPQWYTKYICKSSTYVSIAEDATRIISRVDYDLIVVLVKMVWQCCISQVCSFSFVFAAWEQTTNFLLRRRWKYIVTECEL